MTAPDHMTKPLESLLAQTGASIHGSVPLVARVGGLNDTVIDANEMALAAGVASGFQFSPVTREALELAIARAAAVWREPRARRALPAQGKGLDGRRGRPAPQNATLFPAGSRNRT